MDTTLPALGTGFMLLVFAQVASASDPALSVIGELAALGPLGIALLFLLMLVRGDLCTKQHVEAERKRADRAEENVDRLITAQSQTLAATNDILRDVRGGTRARD